MVGPVEDLDHKILPIALEVLDVARGYDGCQSESNIRKLTQEATMKRAIE
jgi:hypothetical protein